MKILAKYDIYLVILKERNIIIIAQQDFNVSISFQIADFFQIKIEKLIAKIWGSIKW